MAKEKQNSHKQTPVPPEHAARQGIRILVGLLAPVLLAVIIYLPIARHELLRWDDWVMIGENPRLQPPTAQNLWAFWSEIGRGYLELYTPLAYSAFWLIAKTAGLNPAAFHIASLLLHLTCTSLVYFLTLSLIVNAEIRRRTIAAAFVAAIFAIHPIQVETVAWASSFNTLLATFFSLCGLAIWVRSSGRRHVLALGLMFLCTLLACLSKPSAVVLPLLFVLVDCAMLRRPWRRSLIEGTAVAAIAFPFAVIANRIQMAGNVDSPIWARPLVALDAIGFYLAQLAAPLRLLSDYGRSPTYVISHWMREPYFLLGAVAIAGAIVCIRRWREPAIALALFLAALLPVLGLTAFQFQWYSTVADRYAYLPLAVALPIVGVIVVQRWRPWLIALMVLITAAMAIQACRQLPHWRDTSQWAQHQLAGNPTSSAGHRVLGEHLMLSGDGAGGEAMYLRELELRPTDTLVLYNMGNRRSKQERHGEALDFYLRAMAAGSRTLGVYNNGFMAAQKSGRVLEFGRAAAQILDRDPGNAAAHAYLGWVLLMSNMPGDARNHFVAALNLDPTLQAAQRGMAQLGQ